MDPGTGKAFLGDAATWNEFLTKPTREKLVSLREQNIVNFGNSSIPVQMLKLALNAKKNTSVSEIKVSREIRDSISGERIPMLDCHVWYELDGEIDDVCPIKVEALQMFCGDICCTEYLPYSDDVQAVMRNEFAALWEEHASVLLDYQHEYVSRQNTCWMRCGALHLMNEEKYPLSSLRIGSLGFKFKNKTYWHFG